MAPKDGCERNSIHYRVPALILVFWISGVLLAVGHDLYYRSLNQKIVLSVTYSLLYASVTEQQLHLGFGTAFAFLVNAALRTSVSLSFCQLFWWLSRRRTSRKNHTIRLDDLDTAFSANTNILNLFKPRLWRYYPFLLLTALIQWLLPIASIITPATLSVNLGAVPPNETLHHVPSIDFSTLAFVSSMSFWLREEDPSGPGLYLYNGPSQAASSIANAVSGQNGILGMQPPYPNSSWSLNFRGPRLQCDELPARDNVAIQMNIVKYLIQRANCNAPAPYLAWFSDSTLNFNPYVQVDQSAAALSFTTPNSVIQEGLDSGVSPQEKNLSFYLAVIPRLLQTNVEDAPALQKDWTACEQDFNAHGANQTVAQYVAQMERGGPGPLQGVGYNTTMLRCQLYNSTYHTEFKYINGDQHISIGFPEPDSDTLVPITNSVVGPPGNLNYTCATLIERPPQNPNVSDLGYFDVGVVHRLAYQGILQAFTNLIIGNVTIDFGTDGPVFNSQIQTSSLLHTKELKFLMDYAIHKATNLPNERDLQMALSLTNMSETSGMSRLQCMNCNRSLKESIETMFQDFTISLMSSETFQPNYNSSDAPPQVIVTSTSYQNMYSYDQSSLWTAYSIAMFFATFTLILGGFSILANGVSYSHNLSTIMLVGRSAQIRAELPTEYITGSDPLPQSLAKASVVLLQQPETGGRGPDKLKAGSGATPVDEVKEVKGPGSALLKSSSHSPAYRA